MVGSFLSGFPSVQFVAYTSSLGAHSNLKRVHNISIQFPGKLYVSFKWCVKQATGCGVCVLLFCLNVSAERCMETQQYKRQRRQ